MAQLGRADPTCTGGDQRSCPPGGGPHCTLHMRNGAPVYRAGPGREVGGGFWEVPDSMAGTERGQHTQH